MSKHKMQFLNGQMFLEEKGYQNKLASTWKYNSILW